MAVIRNTTVDSEEAHAAIVAENKLCRWLDQEHGIDCSHDPTDEVNDPKKKVVRKPVNDRYVEPLDQNEDMNMAFLECDRLDHTANCAQNTWQKEFKRNLESTILDVSTPSKQGDRPQQR